MRPTPRRWTVLLFLFAFIGGTGTLYYVRSRSRDERGGGRGTAAGPARAPAERSPVSPLPLPAVTPSPGAASGPLPAPTPPADGVLTARTFRKKLLLAQISALSEVSEFLKKKEGAAALAHIRGLLQRASQDPESRLKGIFLARLIPWIASEEPSCLPAALELSRNLLESSPDEWVRFQVLGGLSGFQSIRPGMMSHPDGSDFRFWFCLDKPDAKELLPSGDEYGKSLRASLPGDPALPLLLKVALSADSSAPVRAAVAYAMGAALSADDEPLLSAALSSDSDAAVRISALESLARMGSAELPKRVVKLLSDESEIITLRLAALKQICPLGLASAESENLVAMALTSSSFDTFRADTVEAAFDYQKLNPNSSVGALLVPTFAQNQQNADVVKAFVNRAAQDGRVEYLPVFQALLSSSPDPNVQQTLSQGIRDLQGREAYAARAQQIEELTVSVRELWSEFQNPSTPAPRRNELAQSINTMIGRIGSLKSDR